MDWLTFVSNVISAISWPTAFVIASVVFRRPLVDLIDRINALRWPGGLELGLGPSLEKGQEKSELVALERAEKDNDTTPPVLSAVESRLANEFPAAALEKFYKDAESKLLQIRALIPDKRRGRSLNEVVKWLYDHGHITESANLLWLSIKRSRNDALHHARNGNISAYDAVTFGTQVKQFLDAVHSVKFAV
ncbi:MAG: hypothetical protein Q8M26_16790 [Pseudolabrys sp.]|nr:hypothetical protein [Pseudolabrys sp.]